MLARKAMTWLNGSLSVKVATVAVNYCPSPELAEAPVPVTTPQAPGGRGGFTGGVTAAPADAPPAGGLALLEAPGPAPAVAPPAAPLGARTAEGAAVAPVVLMLPLTPGS